MKKYSCEDVSAFIRSFEDVRESQKTALIKYLEGYYIQNELPKYFMDKLTNISDHACSGVSSPCLKSIPDGVKTIGTCAFQSCTSLKEMSFPQGLESIGDRAFDYCLSLKSLTFKGTPISIHAEAFSRCTGITAINVPWAEGAVANAPWGATNATINYNYVEE
jgi:hypothetical protein